MRQDYEKEAVELIKNNKLAGVRNVHIAAGGFVNFVRDEPCSKCVPIDSPKVVSAVISGLKYGTEDRIYSHYKPASLPQGEG